MRRNANHLKRSPLSFLAGQKIYLVGDSAEIDVVTALVDAAVQRLEPELDPEADDFWDYTQLPWFAIPRDTGARQSRTTGVPLSSCTWRLPMWKSAPAKSSSVLASSE